MNSKLTIGHVLGHAPKNANLGLEASLVDIAQDFLLTHLDTVGILDSLAFKGGTALRKLFAGEAGRFSTDLDFSVRDVAEEMDAVVKLLVESIEGVNTGPFRFDIQTRRGKPYVVIESNLGAVKTLTCKLDVNPPPFLLVDNRSWVHLPVHEFYGQELPNLNVIQIEENIAEKIARLNRVTPARDAYDLVWIMQNRRNLGRELDFDLIRRLSVLKIWVDNHGLQTTNHRWKAAHEPQPFDVNRWLRIRRPQDFDDENIGLLTSPPPDLEDLAEALSAEYSFLSALTSDERTLATCNGRDRTLLLHHLDNLTNGQLKLSTCW
jgi:predicted nucleotidyltransferase component of viral defense system